MVVIVMEEKGDGEEMMKTFRWNASACQSISEKKNMSNSHSHKRMHKIDKG